MALHRTDPDLVAAKTLRAVAMIRSLYASHGVQLLDGCDLSSYLGEAEGFAREQPDTFRTIDLPRARRRLLVEQLADELMLCSDKGLDISTHLKNIRGGELEFGRPSRTEHRIYLKDFWWEVHLAAQLLRAGIPVAFGPAGDELVDLLIGGDLVVQAKHPSSPRKVLKSARQFATRLRKGHKSGLFCVALEDVLRLSLRSAFSSEAEYQRWIDQKWEEANFLLSGVFAELASCGSAVGVVTTLRHVPLIAGALEIREFGGAFVLRRPSMPELHIKAAQHVGQVLGGRATVVGPVLLPIGASPPTGGPRYSLSGEVSEKLRLGQRLGVLQCSGNDPELLGACIWEVVESKGGSLILEMTDVVGVARDEAQLAVAVESLLEQIAEKTGVVSATVMPDAEVWLSKRGIPHPFRNT